MSSVNSLPKELLVRTFNLLEQRDVYQCLFVNKTFYAASAYAVWKKIKIRSGKMFEHCLYRLTSTKYQLGNSIRCMSIVYNMSDEELLGILPLIPRLEKLSLMNGRLLTDKSLTQISRYCKHLESLKLQFVNLSYHSVFYLGKCNQMKALEFSFCRDATFRILQPFANSLVERLNLNAHGCRTEIQTIISIRLLTRLTHLDLCIENHDPSDVFRYFTTDVEGEPCLPHLQRFHLVMPAGELRPDNIAITNFIKTHPHIRELHLEVDGMTDGILRTIACHLPDLETLWIKRPTGFTKDSIRDVARQCSKLSLVEIHNCYLFGHQLSDSDEDDVPITYNRHRHRCLILMGRANINCMISN